MLENHKVDKIKEILNEFLNSIWFVIGIGILLFLKTIFFYHHTIAIEEELELQTIIGTFAFLLVLICFFCALSNRARIIGMITINGFLSLLLFSDHVYYIYSNSFLSVAQIGNLQYGEQILDTLPVILQINQIWYFFDLILLFILLISKIIKIEKKERKTKKELIVKWITGLIGIGIFCIIGVQYVEKGKQKSYNKDLQIREATIFGYHISDIENALTIQKQTKYKKQEDMIKDYDKLRENYEEHYGIESYPLKGILEDKNVIVLQLESVQNFVINKEINGMQITPHLNQFMAQNIQFTDMHMQSYSTTADSEHSAITSLYPMENGMSFSKYYTNTYDNIFQLFKQKKYTTSFMHGNYPYFWNRGNVYGAFQVDHLEMKEQFQDLSENINGDLSDELFYQQAVQKLKQEQGPFFSFLVSASSHTPFTLEGLQDQSKITIDVGKYQGTYFGNYLEAMNYADYAFGILINELQKEGLYENTAILVFGDHNGLNMYNEELIDFLNYLDPEVTDIDLKLNYTNVACGMKIPGISHKVIEKPVNKLDIKPTFASLCNLEDKISLGTSMFMSKDFVSLNNERIITSRYYYDKNWYDRKTGEMMILEQVDPAIKKILETYYQEMKTELEISNSISVNNLLKGK